jgi:hypothetical protein
VLAVVFLDEVRPPRAFDRCHLAIIGPKVYRARFELFRELDGMKF